MGPKSAKSAKYRLFCGYSWKPPGIPGKYPATAWVSCRFPQFCLRFCPRPALRLRETREFPEWSTKHPLFSLEISGNAKCWGPSVFLFVCRKTWLSPRADHRVCGDHCPTSGHSGPRTPVNDLNLTARSGFGPQAGAQRHAARRPPEARRRLFLRPHSGKIPPRSGAQRMRALRSNVAIWQ